MNAPRTLLLAASFVPWLALAQGSPTEGAGASLKVTVIPFAALSAEVPQRAGTKAAGMLAAEVKNAEGMRLIEGTKPPAVETRTTALATARKHVEEATAHRAKRKFRLAEESLQKALAEYRGSASGLAEVSELADAYALLSAILYNTGRDEEAQKQLQLAIALSPNRELPLAATSPMFAQVVAQVRKGIAEGAKGSLLVESVPSGASVSIDGANLGNTPLNVKDVPPGSHVWKVSFPSGESTGGMIEVLASKQAKAMGQSGAKDAETKMLTALSLNRIDSDLVSAAKEHAQSKGADVVVFGALSRDGKNLALDAFLFSVSKSEVRRIGRPTFDAELLSAGLEFYKLVGQLVRQGEKLGDVTKVPSSASLALGSSGPRVADVAYGRIVEREGLDGSSDEAPKQEGKGNAGEPKRRVPLVKKKP